MLKKEIYVESMGCPGNRVDGSRIRDFFVINGWKEAELPAADVVVFNTCAFTQYHEDQAVTRIRKIRDEMDPAARLIIAGCLVGISPGVLDGIDCDRIGLTSLEKLNDLIRGKLVVSVTDILSGTMENGNFTVRVATGCLGNCTFCAIPFANGRLKSLHPERIGAVIRKQYRQGQRSFKLTSEDVGAYGQDRGSSLPDLLTYLRSEFPDISIVVDNLNPNWAITYFDQLIDHLTSGMLSDMLYIPFQSGSDRILKMMRRHYSARKVDDLFTRLYTAFPSIKISTDILVGFPTETAQDFDQTFQLFERYPFNVVSVFEYQDRKGTKASLMEGKVSDSIKNERKEALVTAILASTIKKHNITSKQELLSFLEEQEKLPVNINFHLI